MVARQLGRERGEQKKKKHSLQLSRGKQVKSEQNNTEMLATQAQLRRVSLNNDKRRHSLH